eukprot:3583572-Rhodomonas_salina.4
MPQPLVSEHSFAESQDQPESSRAITGMSVSTHTRCHRGSVQETVYCRHCSPDLRNDTAARTKRVLPASLQSALSASLSLTCRQQSRSCLPGHASAGRTLVTCPV